MATWGSGDGTYLDGQYGGYNVDPDDNSNVTIPLFNSSQNGPLFAGPTMNSASGQGMEIPSNSQFMSGSDTGTGGAFGNFNGGSVLTSTGGDLMGSMDGGLGTGLGAATAGVGTVVGAYEGATTDTGSSVLSGAASGAVTGAEIGSVVPVIGTAFGAVAGAVIGGLAGFFGSKSKKNDEKKAFQQQEQLAIAPQQQAQANWLQQEGLKQQAISNYGSGYTPGGFKYTNGLLGKPSNPSFGVPTANPTLPNFAVSPPDVVAGNGDSSLGIQGNNIPKNSVNLTPGSAASHGSSMAPGQFTGAQNVGFAAPTAQTAPTAPGFNSNSTTNNANLAQYQTDYQNYLLNQRGLSQGAALNGYNQFYGG